MLCTSRRRSLTATAGGERFNFVNVRIADVSGNLQVPESEETTFLKLHLFSASRGEKVLRATLHMKKN